MGKISISVSTWNPPAVHVCYIEELISHNNHLHNDQAGAKQTNAKSFFAASYVTAKAEWVWLGRLVFFRKREA